MSFSDASLEVQKAIVDRLQADAGFNTVAGGRIYDAVPYPVTMPYANFSSFDLLPEGGDCIEGGDVFVTLDAWAKGPQSVEIKKVGKAIAAALDKAPLELEAPQRLVQMSLERTQYLRDPDGITAHAVLTFRAMTEPTS